MVEQHHSGVVSSDEVAEKQRAVTALLGRLGRAAAAPRGAATAPPATLEEVGLALVARFDRFLAAYCRVVSAH